MLNLEGYFGQRAQLRSHGAQPPGTASGSSRLPQLRPVDAERQLHFLWPPLPYRSEQMPLGASSQPLKAGYRPTTGSSELRSHPPARLLSCGAAAAPRSPGEAAGGHFLPRRPRAPRRSRSPAERPPPRDLPRRCPPRETARSVLPPLGCAKLKAMKQRKGQKQRTAAPRTRDGMGGRPDGGHGPASPSAPRRGAAAAGGAPGPYPAPHSRRSGRSR